MRPLVAAGGHCGDSSLSALAFSTGVDCFRSGAETDGEQVTHMHVSGPKRLSQEISNMSSEISP